jgi:hypothetical protein
MYSLTAEAKIDKVIEFIQDMDFIANDMKFLVFS